MEKETTSNVIEICSSIRGGQKAMYKGYLYNKDRTNSSIIHWRCVMRKCKGRLSSNGLLVINEVAHCHEPNNDAVKSVLFNSNLVKSASLSQSPTAIILSDVLRTTSPYKLPSHFVKKSVYKNIQNCRKKKHSVVNLTGEHEIPEFLKYTLNGERFLKHDIREGVERFIILTTRENLSHLGNSTIWLCDGTFYTCPNEFYQLFTIFGSVSGKYFPLVYCLLTSKTNSIYTKILKIIKNDLPSCKLEYVISDFEQAIKISFEATFPNTKMYFCYFHFCQSLFKKFIILGFKKIYEENGEIRRFFKCITALAFVPESSVFLEYQKVKEIFSESLNYDIGAFLKYFESTYLYSNSFSYESWSCYERFLLNIPLTNNLLEGYHNGLKSVFLTAHPTITKFLYEMQCKQHIVENDILRVLQGENINIVDKKISLNRDKLRGVLLSYESYHDIFFLKAVSSLYGVNYEQE